MVATVPTTAGEVDVEDLGIALMHEHVFIRTEPLQWGWPGFGGWDEENEVASSNARGPHRSKTTCRPTPSSSSTPRDCACRGPR
jgi:predicted metal-dependent phosphotriesterase family hydrolase